MGSVSMHVGGVGDVPVQVSQQLEDVLVIGREGCGIGG